MIPSGVIENMQQTEKADYPGCGQDAAEAVFVRSGVWLSQLRDSDAAAKQQGVNRIHAEPGNGLPRPQRKHKIDVAQEMVDDIPSSRRRQRGCEHPHSPVPLEVSRIY